MEINTASLAETIQTKPAFPADLNGDCRAIVRLPYAPYAPKASQGTESSEEDTCVACNGRSDKNDGKKPGWKPNEKPKLLTCPCGHKYCVPCLSQLFNAAMQDERLFPPRCCGKRIRPDCLKPSLPRKLLLAFEEKKLEFETPDRTYCHNPHCSAFLSPYTFSDGTAYCVKCDDSTCARCKEADHEGECVKDPVTEKVLKLAEKQGWKRCHRCRQMIELSAGCHHMTCVCGAQFCYACGEPWRTCECLFWRERRLLERAEQILDRGKKKERRLLTGTKRKGKIQSIIRSLRNNPQCRHGSWKCLMGQFTCEECHYRLPNYILECPTCYIQVCQRCSRNRLPAIEEEDEE